MCVLVQEGLRRCLRAPRGQLTWSVPRFTAFLVSLSFPPHAEFHSHLCLSTHHSGPSHSLAPPHPPLRYFFRLASARTTATTPARARARSRKGLDDTEEFAGAMRYLTWYVAVDRFLVLGVSGMVCV